jgi:hypothetical protein
MTIPGMPTGGPIGDQELATTTSAWRLEDAIALPLQGLSFKYEHLDAIAKCHVCRQEVYSKPDKAYPC